MPVPDCNIVSQNNRAIVAYLTPLVADLTTFVYPANFHTDKKFPEIIVSTPLASELFENGPNDCKTVVRIRASPSTDPRSTQYELARKSFDALVGRVRGLLKMSDDECGSTNYVARKVTEAGRALKTSSTEQISSANQDMDYYICDEWKFIGYGDGEPDENAWEAQLHFKVVCRSSNATWET